MLTLLKPINSCTCLRARLGDMKDPKNTLFSVHQRGKQKTMWYLSNWETMEAQNIPTNRELVTYKSKIFPYTHLHRSMLATITPRIQVADGYEIRFCEDLFINMIREFNLSLNDVHLQYGNRHSLLCDLKTHPNWEKISRELGNKDKLTSWTNELRPEAISLYLPWFYAQHKSDSFPLKFCGHHDRLHHVVEFNLRLSELLLIRDTASGNLVDFDASLLTVEGNRESIDIPEMDGLYTQPTKKECEHSNCTIDEVDGEKELYTESVYYIEDENEVELGKKIQLKVDSKSKQPVSGIYWGAVNKHLSESYKHLILHRYQEGEAVSPIKVTKIESSYGTIMDNKSSYKTERGYLTPLGQDYVELPGLNYYSNSVLLQEDGRKFPVGVYMGGGSLTVVLQDKKETRSEEKFLTFAILKHTRRFKFKHYPRTQQERLNMGCTIEQDDDE